MSQNAVTAELVAVVATVRDDEPYVLAPGDPAALPHGPLEPEHRSLQAGVRAWAGTRIGHDLGYVEQLYTFADRGRHGGAGRTVAISYLGLTRDTPQTPGWRRWSEHLPWEDRRDPAAVDLVRALEEPLWAWAAAGGVLARARTDRCEHAFGLGEEPWRPDLALQRYELLWEAGLVAESSTARDASAASDPPAGPWTGEPMLHDHRRILATGVARLRSMIQYRPVIFELMPAEFTLGQLQTCVEALAGQAVHKQNFRRLVEQQLALVEPTGGTSRRTGGRPARLYRFRSEVFRERRHVGTKLPLPRST